jgi:AraC family transcriptional regulator, ethanolamine operon transcriptional activator
MRRRGVTIVSFSDVDELASTLLGASAVVVPVRPGPVSAEVTEFRLGAICMQIGRSTPLMVLGGLPPGHVALLMPLDGRETLVLNGRSPGPHDVAVYGAGAGYDGANHGNGRCAVVMLPAALADGLLFPPRRSAIRRPGTHSTLRVDPAAYRRAASLFRAASKVAATNPAVFEVAEARRSLRASVLETAQELLAGPYDGALPRTLRGSPGRRRVVQMVEECLRADPRRLVTTEDICSSIRMSQSRVRSAFVATFGLGPQHYLRLRRLALARSALRSGDPRWSSVEQVALAHGFWDKERFARAYRESFGEPPSATFAGAVGHGGAVGRASDQPAAARG